MPRLGVNIDHVATVRQARKIVDYPDPVEAAKLSLAGGADGIVCHLREDRRHIQDRDLWELRKVVKEHLNLEMAASREIGKIALEVKPDTITLVPEKREEITTEGGLDVYGQMKNLQEYVKPFIDNGIIVSMFIEADNKQLDASKEIGANVIEIHTGTYCEAKTDKDIEKEFERIRDSAIYGTKIGLKVAAGHGLHYENTAKLLAIPEIFEYNIGHSIVAKAVFVGIENAVREMKKIVEL